MLPELSEQTHKRWRSLLPMLGVPKRLLDGKNQPCPGCGGKDRFRFTDHEGAGAYFCSGCGPGDGPMLLALIHGWDFATVAKEVRAKLGHSNEGTRPRMDDDTRIAQIRTMWDNAKLISERDDAGQYLASRGFKPPYPKALRFMQNCRYEDGYLPALLARVHGSDGKPFTIHRTYLKEGKKAPLDNPRRMMPGDTPLGSYIPLYAPREGVLAIAEGIETAMRVTQIMGVACWSAISAGGLAAFDAPAGLKQLLIFIDNDENWTGQAAGYRLANRMAIRKDPVPVIGVRTPGVPGTDWADYKYGPANEGEIKG